MAWIFYKQMEFGIRLKLGINANFKTRYQDQHKI